MYQETLPPIARSWPLLRCFLLYGQVPWMFTATSLLVLAVHLSQPFTQGLIGAALHALERGQAVVRTPEGGLDASVAWWWAGVLVGVTVLRGGLLYVATVLSMALGQEVLTRLRSGLFSQVQRLDAGWHQTHGAGEVINRATRDSDQVRDAVTGGFRSMLELGAIIIGTIALLLWYDWLLGVVPAVLFALAGWWLVRIASTLVALDAAKDAAYDGVMQDLSEGIHGALVIKTFALEHVRIDGFRRRIEVYVEATLRALATSARLMPGPQLLVAAGHPWVLVWGAYLVSQQRLGIGELVAAMLAMQAMVFRVEAVGRLVQVLAQARASAVRIATMLDTVPAVLPPTQPHATQPTPPLALRGVRVGSVLRGIDLEIAAGEVVALVGATGSGKSTLAALCSRLRDPDAGTVTLGGIDLRRLPLPVVRHAVQVVFQEPFLFSGTVRDHLRLGAAQTTDAELWVALEIACADDVVRQLPGMLDARIGERGVSLSGGQRQRLCLARALLTKPQVLVGDDATSALDGVTEATLLSRLRASCRQAAVLLVASRRSTIEAADRVVVLAEGVIVATGTPAKLAVHNRIYRELLALDALDEKVVS